MRWFVLLCLPLPLPLPAHADAIILMRNLPPKTVVSASDVTVVSADIPGAIARLDQVVGRETRSALRAGRALTEKDITLPRAVSRNQTVSLHYALGGLVIATEGRALADAAIGEAVQALNLTSHNRVTGTVTANGSIRVISQELP